MGAPRFLSAKVATCIAALALATFVEHAARGEARCPRARGDWTESAAMVTATAGLWAGLEFAKDNLAPSQCKWCSPPSFDASAARETRWENSARANTLSNVLGFVVLPVGALGTTMATSIFDDCEASATAADALSVLGIVLLAGDINQITKFAVGRERPFVHDLSEAEKSQLPNASDNNLSFFSGHTTLAFSLVGSSAVYAARSGRVSPWWMAGAGFPLAATTGYLRMAAGKHYLSDVAVGAAVGTGIGMGGAFLSLRADGSPSRVQVLPTRHGAMLVGQW